MKTLFRCLKTQIPCFIFLFLSPKTSPQNPLRRCSEFDVLSSLLTRFLLSTAQLFHFLISRGSAVACYPDDAGKLFSRTLLEFSPLLRQPIKKDRYKSGLFKQRGRRGHEQIRLRVFPKGLRPYGGSFAACYPDGSGELLPQTPSGSSPFSHKTKKATIEKVTFLF